MDRRRRKIAFLIPHCFRGDNATAIHGSFRPEARGLRTLILDRLLGSTEDLTTAIGVELLALGTAPTLVEL